jgi:hypothetical protein
MNYQEYINLGFKRHEMSCGVEMKETGYGGYSLEKKLSNGMELGVCFRELYKPKLYIPKGNGTFHIIPITFECLQDICRNDKKKK